MSEDWLRRSHQVTPVARQRLSLSVSLEWCSAAYPPQQVCERALMQGLSVLRVQIQQHTSCDVPVSIWGIACIL
ncbi:unnamed protein product [Protopolystoma xenopodis]|uniref:Uncharacterized protein n=1 Tax=Protopolystoma xenopodis TaxID=117903 RepID=A0A3S5A8P1_9PLAT|nr:unnamed protein product [Protopolystoma xenopodis]